MDTLERVCRCRKCGHVWVLRGSERPARCTNPRCRTRCWEREALPNGGQKRKASEGAEGSKYDWGVA